MKNKGKRDPSALRVRRTSHAKRPDDDLATEYARLVAEYCAQSEMKSEAGKRALAEALAAQVIGLRQLMTRAAAGPLTGEEVRAMPPLGSNVRRLAESLGIATPVVEDDPDFGELTGG